MRGIWIVFSFAPLSIPPDKWAGSDKLQHFFSSAFVQSMSYGGLRAVGVDHGLALGGATVTSAAVGVGKEIHDSRIKGEFSFRDLTWDAAGAGAATIMLVKTKR